MNRTKRVVSLLAVAAMLMLLPNAGGAVAQQGDPVSAQATPVGTAFTYQGLLQASGSPISGVCDFQFLLYDALNGGTVKGSTSVFTGTVASGYFTVSLDFGAAAFDGNARWLDISVNCPTGSANWATLAPRQPLTPAPYALYAVNAGTATTATTALSANTAAFFTGALGGDVTGLQGSTTVIRLQGVPVTTTAPGKGQVLTFDGAQWAPADPFGGGVTSVSASAPLNSTGGATPNISFTGILPLANGGTGSATQNFVDLTNAQAVGGAKTFSSAPSFNAAGAPFTVTGSSLVTNLNADLLDSHHASDFQQHYQNVLVVARSGGDFTSISAALATITTASQANPYLIKVAPGVYADTVVMKPYVDIEGSGELTTKITQIGSSLATTGTVVGANNAELRFLTVENTGGAANATAIYNPAAAPRLTHITVTASGGTTNYGVGNYTNASPAMTNVTANVSGGTTNYGVYNNVSSPTMTNISATVSGGTTNYAVFNNTGSSPTMFNVSATASGGTTTVGVYNQNSSSPTMTNVTANASGASSTNYGVYNYTSCSPVMTVVSATVSGGTGNTNYGVYNYSSSSPAMTNVTASASGGTANGGVYNYSSTPAMTNVTASASGGTDSYGVYNQSSSPTMTSVTASASGGTNSYGVNNVLSSPTMTNVSATASGGTNNYGVYNNTCSVPIHDSVISASGGTTNYGIFNTAGSAYTITVDASQITGTAAISQTNMYTTLIGASKLGGGGVQGLGIYTCTVSYNSRYVQLGNNCK
jgi:hypothetical protein